jgi:hypothetical protein
MNRTMSSLIALGIGAATYAMRGNGKRNGKMSMSFADIGDIWTSRRMRKIRKRIAKAIY